MRSRQYVKTKTGPINAATDLPAFQRLQSQDRDGAGATSGNGYGNCSLDSNEDGQRTIYGENKMKPLLLDDTMTGDARSKTSLRNGGEFLDKLKEDYGFSKTGASTANRKGNYQDNNYDNRIPDIIQEYPHKASRESHRADILGVTSLSIDMNEAALPRQIQENRYQQRQTDRFDYPSALPGDGVQTTSYSNQGKSDSKSKGHIFAFTDVQKEELRQRLYIVRNRILSEIKDEDYLSVTQAFSESSFKVFLSVAGTDKTGILEGLKRDRVSQSEKVAVDRYGPMFMEEYNHFLRLHKLSLNLSQASANGTLREIPTN